MTYSLVEQAAYTRMSTSLHLNFDFLPRIRSRTLVRTPVRTHATTAVLDTQLCDTRSETLTSLTEIASQTLAPLGR